MARRSFPTYFENGESRIHYYNSPVNRVIHEPILERGAVERRLAPFEHFSIHDGFSHNPNNYGFGRGHSFSQQVPGRGYNMFEEYEGALVDKGFYSYGAVNYCDRSQMFLNEDRFPVERRLSVGPVYTPPEKLSMFEFREYTKGEKIKICEKLESIINADADVLKTTGPCGNCGSLTTLCCKRCDMWYCSRDCQIRDWPKHKSRCVSEPELVVSPEVANCSPKEETLKTGGKSNHFSQQNCIKQFENHKENHLVNNRFKPKHDFRNGGAYSKENHKSNGNVKQNNCEFSKKTNTCLKATIREKLNDSKDGADVSLPVNSSVKKILDNVYNEREKSSSLKSSKLQEFSTATIGNGYHERENLFMKSSKVQEVSRTTMDNKYCERENSPLKSSKVQEVSRTTMENKYCERENLSLKSSKVQEVSSVTMDNGYCERENLSSLESSEVQEVPKAKVDNISRVIDKSMDLIATASSSSINNIDVKRIDLPKNKFMKVKVTVPVGAMLSWVQPEDSNQLMEIMGILNEDSGKSVLTNIERGMICAALYEGLWFRGKVMQVEPELKVLYIDYGNEERCSPDQLRPIPAAIENIPALAVKIKLAEGTSKKYEVLKEDDVLSVKYVGEFEDAILVHIEGEKYPEKNITSINNKLAENIVSQDKLKQTSQTSKTSDYAKILPAFMGLKVNKRGGCEFQHNLGEDNYGVTIVYLELKEMYTKLFATLKSLTKTSCSNNFKPCVGDIIAVCLEDGIDTWMRARVLAVDGKKYQVNLVDHCLVVTVDTISRLPEEFTLIPELGTHCRILDKLEPHVKKTFLEHKRFFFTVCDVDLKQKKVVCTLSSENNKSVCKVEFTEWIPVLEEEIPQNISLKNNDKVVLTVFFSLKSLCLRSLSQNNEDILSKIEADLKRHCSSASEIVDVPVKNEIVACKFLADGKYYRAQVIGIERDQIKVLYIDYGNMDCVTKCSLRLLTPNLKKIPPLVVKASLKNIVSDQVTKTAVDLLTSLTQNEVEMKVIISGSLDEGVELILPDGKKLNDEINKMLTPESKKKSPEKKVSESKILTDVDIKYLELPVGKTINFTVLHKMDSVTLMGCEVNQEIIAKVHVTMSEKMNKYCESISEESYTPQVSELCFAKFNDGLWYRAMCVSEDTSENNILFLDFGNMAIVDPENIRKMTPEFVELPAVALLCTLHFPPEIATEELKKHADELVSVNEIYEAHVMSCDGQGSYEIELSHVTEALKKLKR